MRRIHLILAGLIIAVIVTPAFGRSWRVERDGSGDFVVIQDAVDAASAGDVIQLGPGRFDEWAALPGYPAAPIYVLVEKELTFVGAGMGQTIVGPEDVNNHPPEQYWAMGFLIRGNGIHCAIRDLTVENLRNTGVALDHGRLEMDRCEIRGCLHFGVFGAFSAGGWIRDCYFHDMYLYNDGLFIIDPSIDVEVARTRFVGCGVRADQDECRNIDVNNCQFEHGDVGVYFNLISSGSIRQCTFDDYNWGILLERCGSIAMENNVITLIGGNSAVGLLVWSGVDNLSMRQNIITTDGTAIGLRGLILSGEIRDNHFLREGEVSWWVHVYDDISPYWHGTIDLENNYWGTTDTALLDQWIHDGNDNEDIDVFIDYLPLADGPVPTESTTWGTVKALFQ